MAVTINSVLVTGGCGFVGARIIRHLQQRHPECQIAVLDKSPPIDDAHSIKNVAYHQVDITSSEAVKAFFHQHKSAFQAVFHVAGFSPPLHERYARRLDKLVFAINAGGTRNVLEAARQTDSVKAFVYTSSVCAVTDDFSKDYANIDESWPLVERGKASSYGESKVEAERCVLPANTAEFRTCAIRPVVIFGEGDVQLVPTIVSCIVHKNESPYRLGEGTNMWDAVYVGNVADAHILALENLLSENPTAGGEAFFIANEEPISTRDFMLQIWKEYNGHIPPFEVQIPLRLAWVVGLLCEVYTWITGTSTTLSRGSVADAVAMRYVNGEKARRILGYQPRVNVEEGLRRTCQWLRDNHSVLDPKKKPA